MAGAELFGSGGKIKKTFEYLKNPRQEAKEWRDIVLERDEGYCRICKIYAPFIIELHHVDPASKKGCGMSFNLLSLCPNCHAVLTKLGTKLADNPSFHAWIENFFDDSQQTILCKILYERDFDADQK